VGYQFKKEEHIMPGDIYITEYAEMTKITMDSIKGIAQVPKEPPINVQKVAFTGTSAASAALNSRTKFVSIQLSANGHVQFAAAPVATSSTSRVHEANAVSFHGVESGLKIAAIDA